MTTPRIACVALVLALAACGGGGGSSDEEAIEPSGWALPPAESLADDDEATTTTTSSTTTAPVETTTTTAPEADPACAAVADLATPVDLGEGDSFADERPVFEAAAATLAADGPEILRPGATRLQELLPTAFQILEDEDTSPEADAVVGEMVDVIDRLLGWSAGSCTTDEMLWACFVPQGFQMVGQSVTGQDHDARPTPEEAVAGEGDLVEVARVGNEVLFAEVGPGGMVVRTKLAMRSGDDGWIDAGGQDCDPGTGGTFTPVGEPIE